MIKINQLFESNFKQSAIEKKINRENGKMDIEITKEGKTPPNNTQSNLQNYAENTYDIGGTEFTQES